MPTHEEIYERHASEYDELICREDHEGNILKAIQGVISPLDLDILDLGAGTGRLAGLLGPFARTMLAFDLSAHMLNLARRKLTASGPRRRSLAAAADHRLIPLAGQSIDLLVSGWSVSYVATWNPKTWRRELESWLEEARRIIRPSGCILLFESLGTGNESPIRLPHLRDFYRWLADQRFASTWIRTDYRFETERLADELAGFFFGEEMKQQIKRKPVVTLPECTGVWWKRPAGP